MEETSETHRRVPDFQASVENGVGSVVSRRCCQVAHHGFVTTRSTLSGPNCAPVLALEDEVFELERRDGGGIEVVEGRHGWEAVDGLNRGEEGGTCVRRVSGGRKTEGEEGNAPTVKPS
jgi:hypothetical protein